MVISYQNLDQQRSLKVACFARSSLIAKYQSLSPIKRQIVQLFSVIYKPVTRMGLIACLSEAGIKDEKGRNFVAKTLKPELEELIKLELILQDKGKSPQCNPLIGEIATRDTIKEGNFERFVSISAKVLPETSKYNIYSNEDPAYLLRYLRICIYRQEMENLFEEYENYYRYHSGKPKISWDDVLWRICNNPFDAQWLTTQPLRLYENTMSAILGKAKEKLIPADEAFNLLHEQCINGGVYSSDYLRVILGEQLLLRGKFANLEANFNQIHSDNDGINSLVFFGWYAFVTGKNEQAIAFYDQALQNLRKATRKKKIYFTTTAGIFFILALVKEGSGESLQQAQDYITIALKEKDFWLNYTYTTLERVIKMQRGDIREKDLLNSMGNPFSYHHEFYHSLDTLFRSLGFYWADAKKAKKSLPQIIEPLYQEAKTAGFDWIALEAGDLLVKMIRNHLIKPEVEQLSQKLGITTLADLIQPQEEWELCLKALMELQPEKTKSTSSTTPEKRLAWFITLSGSSWHIQPKEQSISKNGQWSKGRNVALKRLRNHENLSYLTPQDLKVCALIEADYSYGYYGKTEYRFKPEAICELIEHPFVFWDKAPFNQIDVIKGEPQLFVRKTNTGMITLDFIPTVKADQDVIVILETPTCIKVISIKPEHRRILEIFGKKNKLTIPAKAEEKVISAIGNISQLVTIHSDIGGAVENALEVESHPIPHFHLLPAGEGLKITILCRPFGENGPYYRPANGGEIVIAEIKGQRLQTKRDLQLEEKLAKQAIAQCPTLIMYDQDGGEWLIENPEDCLELLLELQDIQEQVIIEWPQGEKLKVSHRANFDNLSLRIKSQKDWFSVEGKLQLDDELVLELQELLQLLENSPSRFVRLKEGEFLALTQEFRQRLTEFQAFSDKQGNGRRFHPLASLAIEEFIDEVGKVKADQNWRKHLQRLKEMESLQPQIPSTLQAELRDYQIEGFNWLARLSHWGVGACLADDMGLGKTLQALAVILTHASEGASLIIAPTSVGFNWQSEAEKFTPTLNPIMFGTGNRQAILEQLQPFDLLICSYGLLQQEEVAQMLASVSWQTIVLDEAQAIKNFATKRSQGAMKLQGQFKLITTGTPIENHLGELWNLFRFINPGLLGSKDRFHQRFAQPIERDKDNNIRQQLKKLIQPFLLRRTKNQVLTELPSRTEITLQVELSQEEIALYEALRREAIAKLSDSDTQAGQKHLQVLAEIMRLRRACCNPNLVMPDGNYHSSKLEVFGEILTELLENRHKALVFSQFVDHLHILQDYLEKQQIAYQYLDGSTSVKEREKRVKAFQAGEGDVFLISLKAGGTGLNLTAADYVIHMDPWWNPAVEDQASDRSHRIGQKRPVTIYRLVAKNTIEEKIVQLHGQKRDLADSLLEGSDLSGKISTDELLNLIQTS